MVLLFDVVLRREKKQSGCGRTRNGELVVARLDTQLDATTTPLLLFSCSLDASLLVNRRLTALSTQRSSFMSPGSNCALPEICFATAQLTSLAPAP